MILPPLQPDTVINPTHYSDQIIKALKIYKPNIPIVYNTHGYERIEILQEIDKHIDVYLPDIKFFSSTLYKRYTGRENYFDIASKAIEFMAQKPFIIGKDGLLKSGTIVRHLVLPQGISDSKKILDWFVSIKEKAHNNMKKIVLPESMDVRVLEAASICSIEEISKIIPIKAKRIPKKFSEGC